MKKNNAKIKDVITVIDEINVTNAIFNSYFRNGEYTPYYSGMSEVIAIATNFLDGVEFDKNDLIYDSVLGDPELYSLVLRFYYNIEGTGEAAKQNAENGLYINIRNRIAGNVRDMVEYEKQKRIHENSEIEELKKLIADQNYSLSLLNEFINVVIDTFGNFSKLNLQSLSSDDMNMAIEFMQSLKDKNITETTLANAIRKAANKHKMPNTKIYEEQRARISEQQEQLREKESEIQDLRKWKREHEARNVLVNPSK